MPYRPTPKTEAKKAAMRSRLIEAARKLFIAQGYEATTLQQIVREAETSIGNCYFYFPNKEAILLTIAQEFRDAIEEKIDHAIAAQPPGPGLLAVAVYTGVLAVLEQADIARIALSDAALPSLRPVTMGLFAVRAQRAFEASPALFSGWNEATPQLTAHAWHGSVNYVLEGIVTGQIPAEPEQAARFMARWNLQALGLSTEAVQQGMDAL